MKRNCRILFTLCVTLAAGAATVAGQTADSSRAAIQAAVDSGNAQFIEAHRAQDGKLLGSLFCDDGAFLLRNGNVLQGPAAIEKELGEWLKASGPFEMTITTLDLWVIDSLAYEFGKYTRKSLKPDTDTTTAEGRYFEIWKQQPAGGWKILRDCGLPK